MAEEKKSQASWEILGGNNDFGIGSNSHFIINQEYSEEKEENEENEPELVAENKVMIDLGMKMGGEFIQVPDVRNELKEADLLLFTHCHADHIQGLIDYVKMGYDFTKEVQDENCNIVKKKVPIVGSAFTVNYIKAELARNKIPGDILNNIVFIAHDDKNKTFANDMEETAQIKARLEKGELVSQEEQNKYDKYESLIGRVGASYYKGEDGKERMKLTVGSGKADIGLYLYDIDHSTKGSVAVGIEMEQNGKTNRLLHLGDWKEEDKEHSITDYQGLKEFSKKGVDGILMDSTSTVKDKTLNYEVDVKNSVSDKIVEALSEIKQEQGEEKYSESFSIVHSSISRSANRIFDADIVGSVEALMKLNRLKSGDTIDVGCHGGIDFTRRVFEESANMSDSKQYNVLKNLEEKTGVKINFVNGKEYSSQKNALMVPFGTRNDELKQLKEVFSEAASKKGLDVNFNQEWEKFSKTLKDASLPLSKLKEKGQFKSFEKALGFKVRFMSKEDIEEAKARFNKDAIHITTGTQADEMAQLKKVSMKETRDDSSLPHGNNAIYIETQTPIPSGNNVKNVALMNEDLKATYTKFKTAVHSSGHASKEASDKMVDFLMSENPNKNAKIFPVHGAFSQNHLEATARGLKVSSEIMRNGNKVVFQGDKTEIVKTVERGSILAIDGPISDMNKTNPNGADINEAAKHGKVKEYIAYETENSFKPRSYVYLSPDDKMSIVLDTGNLYCPGERLDMNNLKQPANEKQGKDKGNNKGKNKDVTPKNIRVVRIVTALKRIIIEVVKIKENTAIITAVEEAEDNKRRGAIKSPFFYIFCVGLKFDIKQAFCHFI